MMTITDLTTVELAALSAALVRAMPAFDGTEQPLAVAIYRELARGEPVSMARLATRTGVPAEKVEEILGRWPGVYRDSRGALIGFLGLTQAEMPPHRFEVDGQRLWTWCAWDSLFIPAMLGTTARVESVCATTGAPVSITVTPEGIAAVSPPGAVISFLRPEREFDQDVILSFCHHVLFFNSEEAGRTWIAGRPNAFLLSLEQGFELGRLVVEAAFGTALDGAGREPA
jgi:alkylmercury lyase